MNLVPLEIVVPNPEISIIYFGAFSRISYSSKRSSFLFLQYLVIKPSSVNTFWSTEVVRHLILFYKAKCAPQRVKNIERLSIIEIMIDYFFAFNGSGFGKD